jgi:hypothetical protein
MCMVAKSSIEGELYELYTSGIHTVNSSRVAQLF